MRRLLFVLPLMFQAAAQQAPPDPVIRSTTRLIQLNVIVHDRHGQPVRDLKKEDFTVLDNGKAQAVSIFSIDSNAVLPQVAKPAPNVFTNQLREKSAVPSSVTVILLDELNTKYEDKVWAKQQVVKFSGHDSRGGSRSDLRAGARPAGTARLYDGFIRFIAKIV
jgi:hypothetical protein